LIIDLARQMTDGGIASLLNRMGQRTAKGHTWTESRVRSFRGDHRISVYRDGEREERGEVTLEQAAHLLQISKMSVLRMISARELPAHQACKGAAWVIRRDDLVRLGARRALQPDQKGPRTINPNQKTFEFQ
jgi:excisionase family DNA binding protein